MPTFQNSSGAKNVEIQHVLYHSSSSCCWWSLTCLAEQVRAPEEKQSVSPGMPHFWWVLMLCCAPMCVSAAQYVIMCVRLWLLVVTIWFFIASNEEKRPCDDATASQKMAILQCCVWLLAEIRSSLPVFDLNNRKSGVNRHLRFCQFPKNSEVCHVWCVLFIKPWHRTLHISELKYAPTNGTFFFKFIYEFKHC